MSIAAAVGMLAYRQMDDRRTEPLLPDLLAALRRGVRRGGSGMLIAVEGATPEETAEQAQRLVGALRERGHRVVLAGPGTAAGRAGRGRRRLCRARGPARWPRRRCGRTWSSGSSGRRWTAARSVVADRFLASPLVRFGVVADRTQAELDGSELESLAVVRHRPAAAGRLGAARPCAGIRAAEADVAGRRRHGADPAAG